MTAGQFSPILSATPDRIYCCLLIWCRRAVTYAAATVSWRRPAVTAHHAAAPSARRRAIASSSTPPSRSTASVCSPSRGAGRRHIPGVTERRGTILCMGKAPSSRSSTSTMMPRSRKCASVTDRPGRHARCTHRRKRLLAAACREPTADRLIDKNSMLHPRGIGAEACILDHLGAADDRENAPRHGLR